jgi:rifampicin phosphotransferase
MGKASGATAYETAVQNYFFNLETRFQFWKAPALSDFYVMVSTGMFRKWILRLQASSVTLPKNLKHENLAVSLLSATGNLRSFEPAQKIWELGKIIEQNPQSGEIQQKTKEFQLKYGFRFSGELLLHKKSFRQNEETLHKLARSAFKLSCMSNDVQSPLSPFNQAQKQLEKKRELCIELRDNFNWIQYLVTMILHKFAHISIRAREFCRMSQAQLYNNLRMDLREIGKHFVSEKVFQSELDILNCTLSEVNQLIHRCVLLPNFSETIQSRKNAFNENLKADAVPVHKSLNLSQLLDEEKKSFNLFPEALNIVQVELHSKEVCQGMPLSQGYCKGKAMPLKNLENTPQLTEPKVLVAAYTDPGWTPLFPSLSGLILEHGGLLCHGAIVAREFGIPSVAGIPNALEIFKDAPLVFVNGSNGQCGHVSTV